jgi:hypothetical protein
MKLRIASMAKATIMIIILAGFAFWMKDASDCLTTDFIQPTIQDSAKFEKIARWVPEKSEFFLALDVDRALANEGLKKRLELFAKNNSGATADLVRAMLGEEGLLKMIVVVGKFSNVAGQSKPEVVVIAQGDFANNDLIADLRKALKEAGSEVRELEVAGRTVLSEAGDEPFSLAELDDEHIIVGDGGALRSYLNRADGSPSLDNSSFPDAPLFGRMMVGDRLTKLAPEELAGISEVGLVSLDGKTLYAEIPCEDSTKALKLKVFFMGARSVILIRAEENESLKRIIDDVRIGGEGANVFLSIKVSTLLDLWTPSM